MMTCSTVCRWTNQANRENDGGSIVRWHMLRRRYANRAARHAAIERMRDRFAQTIDVLSDDFESTCLNSTKNVVRRADQ